MADIDQSGGWRGRVSLGALAFSVFAVLWFVAAALGTKFGIWSWQFGLLTMILKLGLVIAFATIALSLVALILSLVKAPRKRPAMLALGAVLISGLLTGRLAGMAAQGQSVPSIHDIQTDWADPVVFSETLMEVRGAGSNPVRYGDAAVYDYETEGPLVGRLISDIQEEAEYVPGVDEEREDKPYDRIEPLAISASPEDVFDAAERLAKARGWDLVTSDRARGILEATETSAWFGFKDDIAIRIRPAEGGSRVDARSVSRVGRSDLGANAKRVTSFLYDLDGQRYN